MSAAPLRAARHACLSGRRDRLRRRPHRRATPAPAALRFGIPWALVLVAAIARPAHEEEEPQASRDDARMLVGLSSIWSVETFVYTFGTYLAVLVLDAAYVRQVAGLTGCRFCAASAWQRSAALLVSGTGVLRRGDPPLGGKLARVGRLLRVPPAVQLRPVRDATRGPVVARLPGRGALLCDGGDGRVPVRPAPVLRLGRARRDHLDRRLGRVRPARLHLLPRPFASEQPPPHLSFGGSACDAVGRALRALAPGSAGTNRALRRLQAGQPPRWLRRCTDPTSDLDRTADTS